MTQLFKTVSGKLLLATGAAIATIVLGYSAYSGWHVSQSVDRQVMELATEKAGQVAQKVAVEVTQATAAGAALSGGLAGYLATGEATRSDIIAMIGGVPAQYDTLFGAWMTGIPGGPTNTLLTGDGAMNEAGVFTPYWTKSDSGALNLSTFTVDTAQQWYALPLETGHSIITEPYLTPTGFLLTSVAVPVVVNGETVGIAGVDIGLGDLTAMMQEMRAFDGGLVQLVDSGGKWLANPDPADLTQAYDEPGADRVTAALADDTPRVIRDMPGGGVRLIYPFTAPGMNRTWAAILDVPAEVFTAPVRREVTATVVSGALTLIMALATIYMTATALVRRPLGRMLAAVNGLAEGVYDTPVQGADRSDEIGAMAASVESLRMSLLEKKTLEQAQEHAQAEQARVVERLATGLKALAAGNLDAEIRQRFTDGYEQLRIDFNETLARLAGLIRSISASTEAIAGSVGEITGASTDLSHRTERSAATLEQTAAALRELTDAVRAAADGARQADRLVATANDTAQTSSRVVDQAVAAMGAIEVSSGQIGNIINVIDDIAFQTNLLALNAGVEAARAGESGRGFAVVASEVRALAQRSSDAAREIGALISESGRQVTHGVELVDQANAALEAIIASIADISSHVSTIAQSADEQATGIEEINTAVAELDRTQQQNAAMFEETAAACTALDDEAKGLEALVGQFQLTDATRRPSDGTIPSTQYRSPNAA
ncbi:methyl-accepting chemotaxis protein [Salipiger abyssi]|uniref:Methyl-accepting chemotaxis sensory transducer with Cache sensor n=1 Tax=Salipiger abyssi TaxID=1250539 RepID=A0A1P8UTU1_9RHOB|nr:methyl-accepting chemotaxis protein [Salipiger abyssi]APZ52813.1 methyl-accepting chemotaxis sensory transducer with Cache sensor [Salipiger abyssi]